MDGFNGELNFIQFQVTWLELKLSIHVTTMLALLRVIIRVLNVEAVTQVSHLKDNNSQH